MNEAFEFSLRQRLDPFASKKGMKRNGIPLSILVGISKNPSLAAYGSVDLIIGIYRNYFL